MPIEINNDMHLAQVVTPRSNSGGGVKLIDISTDFDEITKKTGKLNRLLKSCVMNEDVTRSLTGIDRQRYQGLIYFTKTIRNLAGSNHKDLQTIEFKIKLIANQYMKLNSVHLCLPINIKKSTAKTTNIDRNMITVNNFLHTGLGK